MARRRVSRPVNLPPFQALLDAHGRDVHRFLVATVGSIAADDCYQETWLAALRAYPRLKHAGNLRSWIFTVAHRKAIDHVRADRRQPLPVADPPEQTVEATRGRADQTVPATPDGQPEIWARVRALPPKQRTAVALRFVLDTAYPEIAAMMGTSEAAARRNVHEGLKRLRMELEDE
jgi:RNA polymerase sigma factor (sigma-70 family)